MDKKHDTSASDFDHVPSSTPSVVSLSAELLTLRSAIVGARMLIDCVRFKAAPLHDDLPHASDAAGAILALIECRLLLACRVVQGELGADLLRAHHNQRGPLQQGETDIELSS